MLLRKILEFYWGKPSGQMQPVTLRMIYKDSDIKCRLNDRYNEGSIPGMGRDFCLLRNVQSGSTAHTPFYPKGTESALCLGKNSRGVKLTSHLHEYQG
jgi:hypothetical protein